MNVFTAEGSYDRIVSVEMFEHMSNWRGLLTRVRGWIKPDGKLFLHVFSHRTQPYRFETSDKSDWIAQYFFTGGIMPSHGLIRHFGDLFEVEQDWRWSGRALSPHGHALARKLRCERWRDQDAHAEDLRR